MIEKAKVDTDKIIESIDSNSTAFYQKAEVKPVIEGMLNIIIKLEVFLQYFELKQKIVFAEKAKAKSLPQLLREENILCEKNLNIKNEKFLDLQNELEKIIRQMLEDVKVNKYNKDERLILRKYLFNLRSLKKLYKEFGLELNLKV